MLRGLGVFNVGRDWEGIGETLKLSGLPAAESLRAIAGLILEPGPKKEVADQS